MQSMALLDAILEAEWEYRYYSFNSKWSATEQMASMRNGSGDDLFVVFDASGAFLRGFDHESEMSPWRRKPSTIWPGVLEAVPHEFSASLKEPAFHMDDTTFCIWHRPCDDGWACGPIEFPDVDDPDGSKWMLSSLDGDPTTYQTFAREYFEIDLERKVIERVFAHEPLSENLLLAFPSLRDLQSVIVDATEIGYPICSSNISP